MTSAAEEGADDGTSAYDRFNGLAARPWSKETIDSLNRWKQGDLIEGSPLFWAGPAGEDLILGTEAGTRRWEVVQEPAFSSGYMVVTSQTCDVVGTGPGSKQPFVDVSPVFVLPATTSPDVIRAIQRFETTNLVALTSPPGPGTHVVDLRVSLPASKGLLLESTPVAGWAMESDLLDFAEAVSARKRRPALHDALSVDLIRAVEDYIKVTEVSRPEWWEKVEEVRLYVEGDRLAPRAVNLVIIERVGLSKDERNVWRGWFKTGKRLLGSHGITLNRSMFTSLDEMPARLYRETVPLRIRRLGARPTW